MSFIKSFICPTDYLHAVLLGEFDKKQLSKLSIIELNKIKKDVNSFLNIIEEASAANKFPGMYTELKNILTRIDYYRTKLRTKLQEQEWFTKPSEYYSEYDD